MSSINSICQKRDLNVLVTFLKLLKNLSYCLPEVRPCLSVASGGGNDREYNDFKWERVIDQ